ncbi:major facilitator superfamily domain-containing protein 10 isoform X9 [Gallus gallus]|nr:major facilitator superfamily domain-containing protein 10 isoform X9 [Gallus gallus]
MFSILQFFSSPLTGAVSDCLGRRPVILMTAMGLIASYALWAASRSFGVFLLSRMVGGISKGNVSLCTAIIADLHSPKARSKGMAMIGVAFSLGFTLGPMIGAYLAMETEKGEVFYLRSALLALTFAAADLIFIFFLLPETLPKEKRVSSVTTGFQAAADLLSPMALFRFSAVTQGKEAPSDQNLQNLKILGLAYFLYLFLFSGLEYTLSFLTHQRFQFSSMQQGKMFFFIGITMAVIQGGYARRIKPGNEIRVVKRAVLLLIPAFLLIGWAANVTLLSAGLLLYSFAAAIVIPCLSAVVSGYGSASQKGRVMGILRSLGALARALGPVLSATGRSLFPDHGDKRCSCRQQDSGREETNFRLQQNQDGRTTAEHSTCTALSSNPSIRFMHISLEQISSNSTRRSRAADRYQQEQLRRM